MSIANFIRPKEATQIPEPPIARFLFADPRIAWLWTIVRLYVAYQWITAGWEKLTGTSIAFDSFGQHAGSPWVFSAHDGQGFSFFIKGAIAQTSGAHPAVQSWYGTFLQNVVLPHTAVWAYFITFGELLVGLGLLVGCLTGIAAFFGLFMNLNFMLAGAVSINPILGVASIFLILAWRVGGYYGIDRYLLPLLGTPWTGSLARRDMRIAKAKPAVN